MPARIAVRLWGETYLHWPRPEHWLFSVLKSKLRVRVIRRARLTSGQWLFLDPYDSVGREIALHGCYEPETVALIHSILKPGMVVVDAGAHIGQYTLIASALATEQGQVHAFEPDPVTFGLLQANVTLNRFRNVRCNRLALSETTGFATLYLSDVSTSAANSLRPTIHYGGHQTLVSQQSLDDYARSVSLQRLNLLKADVEGAELLLLRGAAEVITRFKPAMILEFSVHTKPFGYSVDDIEQQLDEWGYSLFRVTPMPLRAYTSRCDDPIYFNVLAVHESGLLDFASQGVVEP